MPLLIFNRFQFDPLGYISTLKQRKQEKYEAVRNVGEIKYPPVRLDVARLNLKSIKTRSRSEYDDRKK
jgi:hypothetical protein